MREASLKGSTLSALRSEDTCEVVALEIADHGPRGPRLCAAFARVARSIHGLDCVDRSSNGDGLKNQSDMLYPRNDCNWYVLAFCLE